MMPNNAINRKIWSAANFPVIADVCFVFNQKRKMIKLKIATGVVHDVPADLREALIAAPTALEVWNGLTPLARNEWICWVISVKKPETRKNHIKRVCLELLEGKRRPCCWPGCSHRKNNS